MTPHPSQWGHGRRKEYHPVPSLPPPIRNVKKVALGKPQWGRGESASARLVGLGTQARWCGSMGQGHPAGRLVKARPPPPWRPPWERRLSRSGGECWGGGEEE